MIRLVIVTFSLVACVAPPAPEGRRVGTCGGVLTEVPLEDSPHVDDADIEWSSNPPASGPHFPVWAGWQRRYTDLHRAYWLHNAEHGGVVLLHRCTDCPDVVASLVEIVRRLPQDPHCTPPIRTRTVIASDPLLPAAVGAVAWGVTYTADCVDDTLASFAIDHAGRASENTCADGLPFDGVAIE